MSLTVGFYCCKLKYQTAQLHFNVPFLRCMSSILPFKRSYLYIKMHDTQSLLVSLSNKPSVVSGLDEMRNGFLEVNVNGNCHFSKFDTFKTPFTLNAFLYLRSFSVLHFDVQKCISLHRKYDHTKSFINHTDIIYVFWFDLQRKS